VQQARIGIVVVAYNAESTLKAVLDRIPVAFRPELAGVLVSDDHSTDDTFAAGVQARDEVDGFPITVVRQHRNLGYGGNQKVGYRWAIDNGLDVIVLLHGDGQYAPEHLPRLVEPLVAGEADVVLGSRMMDPGGARRGGMPLYKYIGNRVLSRFQNAVTGLDLTEWHSGYRAYSVAALRRIPFEQNSDGFDFDTEILLQCHAVGARIVELPIPTYYGDEVCHVDGLRYAGAVSADVLRYRLQRMGFGDDSLLPADEGYELKPDPGSSHSWIAARAATLAPGDVLDLGCDDGSLAELVGAAGHRVTGVDAVEHAGVRDRTRHFVRADLGAGLPPELRDQKFDAVVLADILEHVPRPEDLLEQLHDLVGPTGRLLVSVPNFGHWYARARVASGRFDYDRRGILDRTHLRFYTRRSFERLLQRTGWHIRDRSATGLPFDVADRGDDGRLGSLLRATVGRLDRRLVGLRPTLFGYQLLYELEPARRAV
jgi:2-polyprenyl-3-methyl-5-hydroxy-6-metoxy-1,4-benzoquinol methylase